jgi:hypothetical protein
MTFIPTVHDIDASSSSVKPNIFTEDSIEGNYFKTVLPVYVDVFATETNT